MKYINKFSTNADYQAFTEGGGYVTPNICYVTELKGLKFKPKEKYVPILRFTVNGVEYQAQEGMTWKEFINSEYNTGQFRIQGAYLTKDGLLVYYSNGVIVQNSSIIEPNGEYVIE
jgi:hypothetical protein